MTNRRILWNGFYAGAPFTSRSAVVEIGPGRDRTHAFLAQPGADEPRPGVVLLHHIYGWDEFYWEAAQRLARRGYDVICPDLYARYGQGDPDSIQAKVAASGGVHDDSVIADSYSAAQALRELPSNDGRVAIFGACSGGRHALLAASRTEGWDAVIDFWGGRIIGDTNDARPVAPIVYTEGLTAPLLGVFGLDDNHPSPAEVDEHERELRRLGKDYVFHRLEGVGHGFFHYHQPRYSPGPALTAWNLAFEFLADKLP